MKSINKIILVGHLGAKPENRYTPQGVSTSSFSIATNETWYDSEKNKYLKKKKEIHFCLHVVISILEYQTANTGIVKKQPITCYLFGASGKSPKVGGFQLINYANLVTMFISIHMRIICQWQET